MSQIASDLGINNALGQTPTPNRFSELDSEDFIKIIFSELTNQDPLQPNDTSALLEQLNSIRSIEADTQLTKQLETLVTENQLASASNMIGKVVSGLDETFERVSGRVLAATREGDDVKLQLESGRIVPLRNVEAIVDASEFTG
ncbi:MAG: flagellar hook capping FlgD N-terminal domain-containing protein [Planctomycetota bacterium]|jgi:flagellar basal-body rod modification protein FlgD